MIVQAAEVVHLLCIKFEAVTEQLSDERALIGDDAALFNDEKRHNCVGEQEDGSDGVVANPVKGRAKGSHVSYEGVVMREVGLIAALA
jgi:hypothetical protein